MKLELVLYCAVLCRVVRRKVLHPYLEGSRHLPASYPQKHGRRAGEPRSNLRICITLDSNKGEKGEQGLLRLNCLHTGWVCEVVEISEQWDHWQREGRRGEGAEMWMATTGRILPPFHHAYKSNSGITWGLVIEERNEMLESEASSSAFVNFCFFFNKVSAQGTRALIICG